MVLEGMIWRQSKFFQLALLLPRKDELGREIAMEDEGAAVRMVTTLEAMRGLGLPDGCIQAQNTRE